MSLVPLIDVKSRKMKKKKTKEEPKEEPKEETKEETKEATKEEPKEETKEETSLIPVDLESPEKTECSPPKNLLDFKSNLCKKHIVILKSMTEIPNNFLANCEELETLELHTGVTSISEFAFYNCINLKKIKINGSYKKYDESLEENRFPDSLISIGRNAFGNCKSLVTLNLIEL